MAKNTTKTANLNAVPTAETPTYEGNFIGDLQGNADTATSLKRTFTITLSGDASGSFSTAGENKNCVVSVQRADEAEHAKLADSALSTQNAQTASTATFATNANNAVNAGHATTADHADHAVTAEQANHASTADRATEATHADSAKRTDEADHALKADEATHALTADALSGNGDPIPEAIHAQTADRATIADYDCLGRAIHLTYATKDEIPKDVLTEEEAKTLFIPRSEKLLQAVVTGRAIGTGYVENQTLRINITGIAGDGEHGNLYNDLVFSELPTENADTTKAYLDTTGKLHLYDANKQLWIEVTADLDSELQNKIDNALDDLANVVKLTGDQEIRGKKKFTELVEAEIADINSDSDRTVVVLHNLKDVKKDLETNLDNVSDSLTDRLDELTARLDAQAKGDLLFALVDYSLLENQANMVVGTRYLTLLTEDKEYIQLNPDTYQPVDPEAVPYWYRYYIKSDKGVVTWTDYSIQAQLKDYVKYTEQPDGSLDIILNDGSKIGSKDSDNEIKNLIAILENKTKVGDIKLPTDIQSKNNKVTINGNLVVATIDDVNAVDDKLANYLQLSASTDKPNVGGIQANTLYAYNNSSVGDGTYDNPLDSALMFKDSTGKYRVFSPTDKQEVFVVSSEEEITTTKNGLYIVVEE